MSRPYFISVLALGSAVVFANVAFSASALMWEQTELTVRAATGAKEVSTEFRFQNSSSKPVKVVSVASTCDCLTARVDKTEYASGEHGIVRATFATAGREGRQERTILVKTDEAQSDLTTLKLVVDLPEPVALRPRFVFWRVGETANEKEIEVFVANPTTTLLGEVACADPAFGVRLAAGGRSGSYQVKIKPASTASIAQATIRLNATVEGQPRVFVLYAAVK